MRSLQATDIFVFARLLNSIGIKDDIKKIALEASNSKSCNQSELGFDLLFKIFERATQKKVENELFEFLANIFEEDVEEVKKSDPLQFLEKILNIADIEKWKDFFSHVFKLTK